MKHILTPVVLLAILLLSACKADKKSDQDGADTAQPMDVRLICEVAPAESETPYNGVFIIVNESKTKIADINACEKINPADYTKYDIPKEALIAVGGWWAGAGDYFYVLRQDANLTVYHAQVDEAQEVEGYHYLPVVRYEEGRFSFEVE